MSYKRIVIKLGTNLLTAGSDHLNLGTMASLVEQIARLHRDGADIVVVSSGAIAAGRHHLRHREPGDISSKQVLAAVGQSHLMKAYDELFGWHEVTVAQALLTRGDIVSRLGYLNARNTLSALIELRVIPIVNENDVVAVEEIEAVFGDNDNLSAMVANLTDADLLMLLTNTGGLYTCDPHVDPNACLIPRVDRIDAAIERLAGESASERGTGGMATKIQAAKIATACGVAVVIADGKAPDVIVKLAGGESMGTFFPAQHSRLESRKRWMLGQISRGTLVIDRGALSALRDGNRSLLPAGVVSAQGDFDRGDVVSIADREGSKVACGISNYSAKDIGVIKGARSVKIAELLGYEYGAEVVHRDNLVVL